MTDNLLEISREKLLAPEIATWFGQMKILRELTLETVKTLSITELDYSPNYKNIETIGTLLLHIAAVEWSWVFQDIVGVEMDFQKWKYGFPLRPSVNIPQIKDKDINYYLELLNQVRSEIYDKLCELTDKDLRRIIIDEKESFTVEWILYHLIEHEAMHLGQIKLLVRLFKQNK